MIVISSVSKRYGSKEAVHDISLRVQPGEVLGLLGPNGAGKTTLLNMLTGFMAPTQGSISLDGHDLTLEPRQAKQLLGYLPEQAPLYDEMTVRDFLRFVCALRLVVKADAEAHIDEILQLTHTKEVEGRRIGNLSKGWRQRVGLAQALCGDPPILVLDEPTSGLDPRQTVEFRELVRSLSHGRTVIFSSHVLSEVQEVCTRAVILHRGRVVFDEKLQDIGKSSTYRLSAKVLGSEKQLMSGVRSLPSVISAVRVPCDDKGQIALNLTCKAGGTAEQELFTLLTALEMPLMRLEAAESTLEEVFLRCTQS